MTNKAVNYFPSAFSKTAMLGYISIWIYFRLYGICPGDYYRWNWSIYTVYFTKYIQITFQNGKALGMSLSTPAA